MVQKVVEHVERWKRVEKGGIPVGIGGNRCEQGVYRVTGCECDKYKSNGAWVMTSAMTWIVR